MKTEYGLLFRKLFRQDTGTYYCRSQEQGFTQTVTKIILEVVENEQLEQIFQREQEEELPRSPCRVPNLRLVQGQRLWFKDIMHLIGYGNLQRVEEYCERVWCGDRASWHKGKLPKSRNLLDGGKKGRGKQPGDRNRVPRQAVAAEGEMEPTLGKSIL